MISYLFALYCGQFLLGKATDGESMKSRDYVELPFLPPFEPCCYVVAFAYSIKAGT